MKRVFILILTPLMLVTGPVSTSLAEAIPDSTHVTCEQGILDGRQSAAEHYSSSKWLWLGAGGGLVLNLFGAAAVIAVSQTSRPQPPSADALHIAGSTMEYRTAYAHAYARRARNDALYMAIAGGLAGTAVAILLSELDH